DKWWPQVANRLDPYGIYLTQLDLKSHSPAQFPDPSGWNDEACESFNQLFKKYRERLTALDAYLAETSTQAYDSTLALEAWWTEDTPGLAKDEAELQKRWTIWWQQKAISLWFEQEADSIVNDKAKFLAAWEALYGEAGQKLRCETAQALNPLEGLESLLTSLLLDAMANQFDPHSNYFSLGAAGDFEADLATAAESFGLEVSQNEKGEIAIDFLQPGGPAWRSNALNQGDVLLSLRPQGEALIDLACADPREVQALLNGNGPREITLKVRKKSGQIKTVKLEVAALTVSENVVTGFLLEGESKLGYLYLPGFYSSFEDNGNYDGLANDVAKELLKLRLKGMEGLILDLRFNGGGNMYEAIALSGLFIDEGPVGLWQERGGEPETIKDFYRGLGYDGPLMVMVNGASASASEMFAAAMQDYHRAVIVGSPSYGKATSQVVWPLSEQPAFAKAQGMVKVTGGKFFRPGGGTHQRTGVLPDVILPDLWQGLITYEVDEPRAIEIVATAAARNFTPLAPLPLAELKAKSQA
ncbi:MAG: S41 family peptidase, partial [Bacteroidota bacterium]